VNINRVVSSGTEGRDRCSISRTCNQAPVSEEQRRLIVQANALTQQKQYSKASYQYRRVIELDQTAYPETYFNLASLSDQENFPVSAIFYMKHYLLLVLDAKDARSAQDKIYEWEFMIQRKQ
jgi:hypothetical protein